MTECKRCVSDDSIPNLELDSNGVCSYCRVHDFLESTYPISSKRLKEITSKIKADGKGKPFDAVIGVSGGKDSSYLLYLARELGIRPLAVHYDNGWDTPIAKKNIEIMTEALSVSLINYKVDQDEVDDLIKAFLFSHTKDAEAATDLGLVKCLFHAANSYGIKYILDGHSFRTEGIAPIGWSYMDGRYVKSVYDAYSKKPLESYPLLGLADQLWYGLKGIKRPRLLYHIDYNSEEKGNWLTKEFGWEWYGGHHLENIYTAFFDYYYRFHKLGYDGRKIELSALVRSGQMKRDRALELLSEPVLVKRKEEEIISEIKIRLDLSEAEFDDIMNPAKLRNNRNWPTYRKWFKRLKPLFWAMAKSKRIPDSFYIKYCKGV